MSTSFAALGVPDSISRALAAKGITAPFPIQAATIPDGIAGRDLCGKAATGSGKTIAFGIPMVMRVKRAAPKRPKGLVLAPTRELALQVADELRAIGGDLRVLAVYGGAGIEPQLKALRNGIDIVVACPGRLLDVIDRKACDLRDVSFVVVDEFGSLAAYAWSFEPDPAERPPVLDWATLAALPTSPTSVRLAKDLKRRGWTFVGPTTVYAFMQAMGLVNDHVEGCHVRGEVLADRADRGERRGRPAIDTW